MRPGFIRASCFDGDRSYAVVEIEFASGARMRIAGAVDPSVASAKRIDALFDIERAINGL